MGQLSVCLFYDLLAAFDNIDYLFSFEMVSSLGFMIPEFLSSPPTSMVTPSHTLFPAPFPLPTFTPFLTVSTGILLTPTALHVENSKFPSPEHKLYS